MSEKKYIKPNNMRTLRDASAGTGADSKAGVKIGDVFGGYFSKPQTAERFCEIGIGSVESLLPASVRYADFGGGDGFLTQYVAGHIKKLGRDVSALVVDANADYLAKAQTEYGLKTKLADLRTVELEDKVYLITMRAVNHYSDPVNQVRILQNVHNNLADGGIVISQISSGSVANCDLRSKIVNVPSLGRAGEGKYYHWTSVDEYIDMLRLTGFKEVQLLGYAQGNAWGPEEQWERFHAKETKEAQNAGDEKRLAEIKDRRGKFLKSAYALIDVYEREYGDELDVERRADGTAVVHYKYPIIVARK